MRDAALRERCCSVDTFERLLSVLRLLRSQAPGASRFLLCPVVSLLPGCAGSSARELGAAHVGTAFRAGWMTTCRSRRAPRFRGPPGPTDGQDEGTSRSGRSDQSVGCPLRGPSPDDFLSRNPLDRGLLCGDLSALPSLVCRLATVTGAVGQGPTVLCPRSGPYSAQPPAVRSNHDRCRWSVTTRVVYHRQTKNLLSDVTRSPGAHWGYPVGTAGGSLYSHNRAAH